jgi:hypothetical protein
MENSNHLTRKIHPETNAPSKADLALARRVDAVTGILLKHQSNC